MADDASDDRRLTAMGLLIEVYEGVTAALDLVHGRQGLSGTDFDTLIRLARSPHRRLRMGDLAAQTALSTSGITRIVDRLERRDLVRRESCPGDRRSSLAVLTDEGSELLTAHVPDVTAAIERWLTGVLTPEQLDSLLDALHTVRGGVRPDAAAGARG
ncbi:MAG: MarR family transcriptional regulator [Pseudonocardiaceae bacterium]|nr:MarR family transcriptional regulator [Pseudonocardiaceae bacterium]